MDLLLLLLLLLLLRRLLHKRRKVRVFAWKGIRENMISYYSSAFAIKVQP